MLNIHLVRKKTESYSFERCDKSFVDFISKKIQIKFLWLHVYKIQFRQDPKT